MAPSQLRKSRPGLCLHLLRRARSGTRVDLRLLKLIEERAVADIEPFGGLAPAPAVRLQYLENHFSFDRTRRGFCELLQGKRVLQIHFGKQGGWSRWNHVSNKSLFAADENIAAQHILQLTDVSW